MGSINSRVYRNAISFLYYYYTKKASGFTTTTQSLSYNNPEQKITIDYPPDWRVCCEKNGPQRYNPDNMFSVMFDSPTITIESLDPPTITLQEHQKKQIDIFSAESPDVKLY